MRIFSTQHHFFTLIAFAVLIPLTGCEKEKDMICPELDYGARAYMVYQLGEELTFQNSEQEKLVFRAENKTATEAYMDKCRTGGLYSHCDCKATGEQELYCIDCDNWDGQYGQRTTANITAVGEAEGPVIPDIQLQYTLRNFYCNFRYNVEKDQLITSEDHVYWPELDVNGKKYKDVYEFRNDTNNLPESYRIWKVFISPQIGFLGFHDRKSASTYYLVE